MFMAFGLRTSTITPVTWTVKPLAGVTIMSKL